MTPEQRLKRVRQYMSIQLANLVRAEFEEAQKRRDITPADQIALLITLNQMMDSDPKIAGDGRRAYLELRKALGKDAEVEKLDKLM